MDKPQVPAVIYEKALDWMWEQLAVDDGPIGPDGDDFECRCIAQVIEDARKRSPFYSPPIGGEKS